MESPTNISKSRLEINFVRLLDETQQMANGNRPKDWTFEKVILLILIKWYILLYFFNCILLTILKLVLQLINYKVKVCFTNHLF